MYKIIRTLALSLTLPVVVHAMEMKDISPKLEEMSMGVSGNAERYSALLTGVGRIHVARYYDGPQKGEIVCSITTKNGEMPLDSSLFEKIHFIYVSTQQPKLQTQQNRTCGVQAAKSDIFEEFKKLYKGIQQ